MAQGTATAHEVPALSYAYNALEPHIDEQTMHLHHDKHHAAYVTKLNGAIEKHPELGSKSAEDLLRNLNALPEDVRGVIRNNGGGHVNHTMFWELMGPGKGG
ncbi:MAG TPA: superoxide dismutase, partial [Candidatus Angelobacter sp.]|nr:superoxide dismutase [Candidatus Angelobacter sp.]